MFSILYKVVVILCSCHNISWCYSCYTMFYWASCGPKCFVHYYVMSCIVLKAQSVFNVCINLLSWTTPQSTILMIYKCKCLFNYVFVQIFFQYCIALSHCIWHLNNKVNRLTSWLQINISLFIKTYLFIKAFVPSRQVT